MRSSSNKNGFTMIDHISFDNVLPSLSPAAQLVYLRIYRQTIGWQKPTDAISLSQFKKKTNYKDHKTIEKAIVELKQKGLINVEGEGTEIKQFSINMEAVLLWEKFP